MGLIVKEIQFGPGHCMVPGYPLGPALVIEAPIDVLTVLLEVKVLIN